MFWATFLALVSHWRRRVGQLATFLIGLALAAALWSGVQAMNAQARAAYAQAAATLTQNQYARLTAPQGQPVPIDTYVELRRAGHQVSPVISGIWNNGDVRLRILGIDPLTAPVASLPDGLRNNRDAGINLAQFLTEPGLLLVNDETAEGLNNNTLPPVIVASGVPSATAITDIATAARILGRVNPDYLLVNPTQPPGLPPMANIPDLVLNAPQSGHDIGRLTDSFHLNLTAFGLLGFIVGLFIVHGTVGLAFEQRRHMVRSLRAMGVPLRTLLAAFGFELLVLSAVAIVVGLTLGHITARILMPGVAGTLRDLYGADISDGLTFRWSWALAGAAMTLVGAGLATAHIFLHIARLPILAIAQPQAWTTANDRAGRRRTFGAVGLAVMAMVLLWAGDGLLAGFAFLAALLLACALMLPSILTMLLTLGQRYVRGAKAEWMMADARQQVPGLSLALMALMLALATNIGVSTMVGSFRATFVGWLDQRLAAELYITPRNAAEAAVIEAFLAPRTQAVLPNIWAEVTLFGQPADILGIADHATYRDFWPLIRALPGAWDELAENRAIFVNEQMARRHTLDLGDLVTIRTNLTLPIAGIYSDYGNPKGQVILGLGIFQTLFPDETLQSYAVRVAANDIASLTSAIVTELDLPPEAVVNQTAIKTASLQVFERTFRITGALNILTLGVAGFALFTSLLTLSVMRLHHLAPVWAMGVPRATLARDELVRAILFAALTFLAALPVGLLLAWGLLAVVNVAAFGWRLPMVAFPVEYIRLGGLALIAAILAALVPARRLAKMEPHTLLQVFSHDR